MLDWICPSLSVSVQGESSVSLPPGSKDGVDVSFLTLHGEVYKGNYQTQGKAESPNGWE